MPDNVQQMFSKCRAEIRRKKEKHTDLKDLKTKIVN